MTVDIAVPFAVAGWVGAVRVASIRAGRISLVQHEAQTGSRLGGHTILKHVGKTEAQLRARLAAERDIKAASSFTTLGQAERAISSGLRANAALIQAWAKGQSMGKTLRVTHDTRSIVGQTIPQGNCMSEPRLVIKARAQSDKRAATWLYNKRRTQGRLRS